LPKRKAIPKKIKDKLLVEARHRCCLCPEHPIITNAHHIIPISGGGPNTKENLVLVCGTCHDYIHRIPNLYTPEQLREYKRRWAEFCWPRNDLQVEQDLEQAPAAPRISLAKLPDTGLDLFGRDEELSVLDQAWEDPHTNILAFIAFGGIGKSAIVNHWLRRMENDDFRGARRVFGWSFYSQGTSERTVSADQFIHSALTFFGDPNPNEGSPWGKGQRLAQLVRQQPTLLVLDGLEPLQWGPGPQEGELKDRAGSMYPLLRDLSHGMDGLCVLSSRVDITDIPLSDTSAPARRINLERLSKSAGRDLLLAYGVRRGATSELEQVVEEEYDGHALALCLLGEYLADFLDGDIAKRDLVPALQQETRQGKHAFRVMEAYDIALKRDGREAERAILRIIGLFDRPASEDCLDALRREPAIKGVTNSLMGLSDLDWRHAIGRLRKWRLLNRPRGDDDGSLDTHPLVREYFGHKLEHESPEGFRQAHSRLYECLRDTTKEFPDTLEEMEPLFQAVHHGCRAANFKDAFDQVYGPRIQRLQSDPRQHYFTTSQLSALTADLSCVSHFFRETWSAVMPGLSPAQGARVLHQAGYDLAHLGRLMEAETPLRLSYNSFKEAQDLIHASRAAGHLAVLYLASGRLIQGEHITEQALADAHDSTAGREIVGRLAARAVIRYQRGRIALASQDYIEAEQRQRQVGGQPEILHSLRGYQYCSLLLDLGQLDNVQKRASILLEAAGPRKRDVALAQLAAGRRLHAAMACAADLGNATDGADRAGQCLDEAVVGLQAAGQQDHVPRGLLARAAFHRDFGDRDQAERDLHEALELSTRIGLRLHETDARFLEGHMALDLDPPDIETAQHSLSRADELVQETGYHLRDADLLILEGRLLAKQGDKDAGRAKLQQAITTARREEPDGCVYQLAVDQAERYLTELDAA